MNGFDGKIVNRIAYGKKRCGKCRKIIPEPEQISVNNKLNKPTMNFTGYSYLGTPFFIYETKRDYIAYCSKYCAKKHNHRFHKK